MWTAAESCRLVFGCSPGRLHVFHMREPPTSHKPAAPFDDARALLVVACFCLACAGADSFSLDDLMSQAGKFSVPEQDENGQLSEAFR